MQVPKASIRPPTSTSLPRVGTTPTATYRLQFNPRFTLTQAERLVEYLEQLGISHCYASPLFKARPQSTHGYDIVDPTTLNPELGGEETFARMSRALRRRGMGLILDVVPNHMAVASPHNRWWVDVLEYGPASPYAAFFDVDWRPREPWLERRVLMPVLQRPLEEELRRGRVALAYRRGTFVLRYAGMQLPIAPHSHALLLHEVHSNLGKSKDADPSVLSELQSLQQSLEPLPLTADSGPEAVSLLRQTKRAAARKLRNLISGASSARAALRVTIDQVNKAARQQPEAALLSRVLDQQAYRLAYWQDAQHVLNYRRFFDVNELAGLRMEEPRAFQAVHQIVIDLVHSGSVTGLRIDHVDGLAEPGDYLRRLRAACERVTHGEEAHPYGSGREKVYIIAEKILACHEQLHSEWPIEGTTGYDFLNRVNALFIAPRGARAIRRDYVAFTGQTTSCADIVVDSRKHMLRTTLASELKMLIRLHGKLEAARAASQSEIERVIVEIIANLAVYRTYSVCGSAIAPRDAEEIGNAAARARRRIGPQLHPALETVVRQLLAPADSAAHCRFLRRFQQLCSAAAAKGEEDTAFYRYYPLASLNEVGGRPDSIGITRVRFHRWILERHQNWPDTLNATSTHDAKRSEDVRARINVLTEIPEQWQQALRRWHARNRRFKTVSGNAAAPDSNEEYLFYQTLVGIWPLQRPSGLNASRDLKGRIKAYMEKALREAKVHTTWHEPNPEYEQAVLHFIDNTLDSARNLEFIEDFDRFHSIIARCGLWNSLSQLTLKIASPGVPDFYQGSELWQLQLVDPDNRQPVDYDTRRELWRNLCNPEFDDEDTVHNLLRHPEDGRIKLFMTARLLGMRKANADLFHQGDYVPLRVSGSRRYNVIACARTLGDARVLAVAGRFFCGLRSAAQSGVSGIPPTVWQDTALRLPPHLDGQYRDVLSGRVVRSRNGTLHVGPALNGFPATILVGGSARSFTALAR